MVNRVTNLPTGFLSKKETGESLKVGEDLHPQIMHDPLTCQLHGIDLKEIESKIDRQNENDEKGDPEEPFDILFSAG